MDATETSMTQEMAVLSEQQATVRQLASRDREVRSHEHAHAAVGGAFAGHPQFQFTKGPNGVRYASSGHVNIDVSPVAGDPQATLDKMNTVRRAALAPANPSAQDRAVAAKASAQAAEARAELVHSRQLDNASTQRAPDRQSTLGSQVDLII